MKTILCLFVIYTLLGSCVSGPKKQTKQSQSHHRLAFSLIQKCQFPLALQELSQALKLTPNNPYLHHSLAIVYFQFKKQNKAIHHLRTALRLKPDFTQARVHIGRSLIEIQQIPQAIKQLKQAQKDLTYVYPENIHAHLGLAYYKQGKFDLAQTHFEVSRKIKTQDCALALYHGRSLYFLNRPSQALTIFEKAKQACQEHPPLCSPPSYDVYFFTALTYYKMKNKDQAVTNLKIFLSRSHDSIYKKEAQDMMKRWRVL